MSIEKDITEVTQAVSEETLVNIPEVADTSTVTLVGTEADGSVTAKKFTVEYKIIPTVPICAITSITLLTLGIVLLFFSAGHINEAANGGIQQNNGNYALLVISGFLFAFGIIVACPCFIPIIYCLCLCFGIQS